MIRDPNKGVLKFADRPDQSDYGYCPHCGAPGRLRERRLNGNDTCQNGHVYPSKSAVKAKAP